MPVQSLGWEDALERGMATHSLENPMGRRGWQATFHGGHKQSDTTEHTHMQSVLERDLGKKKLSLPGSQVDLFPVSSRE